MNLLCHLLQQQIHQVAPKKGGRNPAERVSRKTEKPQCQRRCEPSCLGTLPFQLTFSHILTDDVTQKSNPQTKLESVSAFTNPYKIESGFWVKIFGSSSFL